MAELTVLDEKVAEVLGLAQAAQQATERVATLARKEKEEDLIELMREMGEDASHALAYWRPDVAPGECQRCPPAVELLVGRL
ncbi:MAG: hypothetical protein ACRDLP_02630 [Solirubrobacteraceae bacterium]